jgi:hypothetical protein
MNLRLLDWYHQANGLAQDCVLVLAGLDIEKQMIGLGYE